MSEGAVVTAYFDAPLCAGAKRELASEGDRAGAVRVRVACLPSAGEPGRLSLATVGANARRAVEDSTAIVYVESVRTARPSFSRPIVEAASIAWLPSNSGEAAMSHLLTAISGADSSSLRDSVHEALD